jgi:hypothetical protein
MHWVSILWLSCDLELQLILATSAVFQQIDIEEYIQPNAPPSIRVYGVTQVSESTCALLEWLLNPFRLDRKDGRSLCTSKGFSLTFTFMRREASEQRPALLSPIT